MEEITLSVLFIFLLVLFGVWESIWKAIGLWKSAKKGSVAWFVCIFIFNTLGILPILYIYVFSKDKKKGRIIAKASKSRR